MLRRTAVKLMSEGKPKTTLIKGTGKLPSGALPKRIPLQEPRAVAAEEASKVEPAKESTKTTMMPWKGWFGRWVRDTLGEERHKQWRQAVFFWPDDEHDLYQQPLPSTKVKISETEEVSFRHPSPGSQTIPIRQPKVEEGEDPYNNNYYVKDTARRYLDGGVDPAIEQLKLDMLPKDDPRVQEMQARLDAGPEASPGNKGRFATGPSDFDPSGLRATMSTNYAAMNAELDKHMPDHLPTPDWAENQEELVQWYEDRDLPVPVGGTGWGTVPVEGRVARW